MSESLDRTDFYDLTLATDLAVSPDGDRVAFVADEFDSDDDLRRSGLFVVPTDGSRAPYRLTRVSDAGAPKWSPDGSRLGFVAARETDAAIEVSGRPGDGDDDSEADGDEPIGDEPKAQVWAFDLERGGDARQLTEFAEGVSAFDWGPAGDRLVAAARDPTDEQREYLEARREDDGPVVTEHLQHKYDGQGWLDDVTTHLFVVDRETREAERLDDAYGGGAHEPALGMQPAWSPAGDRIAFLSNRTDRPDDNYVMDLYTIAPDGSALRKVTDSELTASRPRWHPDGDRLAFVGIAPENWHRPAEAYVAEPEPREYESRSADLDRPVAGRLAWDGGDLFAPVGDEGLTRLVRLPDGGGVERTFAAQGRDRTLTKFDLRGGTAAVLLSDPGEGRDLHAIEADALDAGTEPTRLTDLNAELVADHRTPQCRRLTYQSDGAEIEALAYLPPEFDPDDSDPLPLIASIHGGPVAYDAPTFSFEFAYWIGRGYAVL